MIPALVLAAGRSSRMGRPKALLQLGKDIFLTRIVGTLREAQVEEVVVVLGYEAEAVAEALSSARVSARAVVNEQFEQGQLSSLIAGLAVIDRPDVVAGLVTLVDMPLVAPATVRAVLSCYRRTHAPVVRPTRDNAYGHPVLFDRSLFSDLRAADPAAGIRSVVRAYASPAGAVRVNDDGAFLDVDTPAEYEQVLRMLDRP
jgi:molybdenum cofactor cytidylyltransferase